MAVRLNVNAMPNGMSVSVTREGDGPAQITVKKGDKTWTVSSDDAKALAELPEDVRNVVSGMINGQNGGIQRAAWQLRLASRTAAQLPDRLGNLPGIENAFKAQEDEVNRQADEGNGKAAQAAARDSSMKPRKKPPTDQTN